MKKINRAAVASLIAAGAMLALSCGQKKVANTRESFTPTQGWNLYMPGTNNKDDVRDDLAKSGWLTGDKYAPHFSLVDADEGGRKVLKLNTLDGVNDAIVLPLSGNEKKVSLMFKAQGAVDPDKTTTPFGILYAFVQKGGYQTLLRHNSSNQIKGSKNQSRLTEDGKSSGKKIDIVSDWHDYIMVFDVANPEAMTAKLIIDGVVRHEDICKKTNNDGALDFADGSSYLLGDGNYLEFGENDGSTNGFGRYAYLLVVVDDDIENMSVEEIGKKVNADLTKAPSCTKDPGPQSKRPAKKPAGINMQAAEIGKPDSYVDRSAIENGTIDLSCLPYSQNETKIISTAPALPKIEFAAKVGENEQYKTIASAIEAVPEGSAILIQPGLYYEKLVITKPGITLVGTNPANTIIYGYEADTGGIDGNILVEVNYLPKGTKTEPGASASIPEKPAENAYFNAANITFYNKGAEWNKQWGGAERRSETLGLKGVDKSYIENCVFLGQQDTIYFRSGRIYMKNCYIEGDVDYICGGATTVFDNCHIHTLPYANGGIIVAAASADTGYSSTAQFANGYVFKNCLITADDQQLEQKDGKRVTLGRGTWVGGSATKDSSTGKIVYIGCDFGQALNTKLWNDWDSTNTVEKAFFRVHGAKGEGASVTSSAADLTAEELALYSDNEKILGFVPSLVMSK
ncbi:MAG: hypothetical protein IIU02_10140 [Treponema sp.]|uniref:pectinesterase family protein n=1 Tax=Treponema sp. TaxID=166 RepID=UPI00257D6EAF|nr:pectinesterase family protein [Treponema sp.]MBQ5538249.1 hypothetical protein [Treponema sp.]